MVNDAFIVFAANLSGLPIADKLAVLAAVPIQMFVGHAAAQRAWGRSSPGAPDGAPNG